MKNVRKKAKVEFNKKKLIMKKILHNNQNWCSGEHINPIQIMVVTYSNKIRYWWIYLGFAVLGIPKFLMYETYFDKIQRFFGNKNTNTFYGYW